MLTQIPSILLMLSNIMALSYCSDICSKTELVATLSRTNGRWSPEPCLSCTCLGSKESCTRQSCSLNACPQGTQLTFKPDQCCPVCEPLFQDCISKGLRHGKTIRNGQCEQCLCYDGVVTCTVQSCAEMDCSSASENACCHACAKDMCYDDGNLYKDGSYWPKGACAVCHCNGSTKQCFSKVCPALSCKNAFTPEGACCPICPNSQCWTEGELYQNGDNWKKDTCTQCSCIAGMVDCSFQQSCFKETCLRNQVLKKDPDQCCPECVSSAGMCVDGEDVYSSGQIWKTWNECGYCMCDNERITCTTAQCAEPTCKQDEYVYQPEGACCPVCKRRSVCMYNGQIKQTKEGGMWRENECRTCTCVAGEAVCYESNCQPVTDALSGDLAAILGAVVMSPAVVTRRESTVISTENIKLIPNTPDIRITLLEGPAHGTIRDGRRQFAYSELATGLTYQHDGSASNDDYIVLQASKDNQIANVLLPIEVQSSQQLTSVVNEPLSVTMGDSQPITELQLLYEAGGGANPENIKYQIVEKPQQGPVLLIVPKFPDANMSEWADLADGLIMKEISKFTQLDIRQGSVHYQHVDVEAGSTDFFKFKVMYVNGDVSTSIDDEYFDINILSANQFDAPYVTPGVTLGIEVDEGAVATLTSSDLAYEDSDTQASDIIFTITSAINSDNGFFELTSNPEVPISTFTQEDINSQRVAYRSPNVEIGPVPVEFDIVFTVTDNTDRDLTDQNFLVRILPVDNQAPVVAPQAINIPKGGEAEISDDLLGLTDPDTHKTELKFFVMDAPRNGDIVYLSEDQYVLLRQNEEYPYRNILDGNIHYVHDNTNAFDDSFVLKISDTAQASQVELDVQVQYEDVEAPAPVGGASLNILVMEAELAEVGRDILEYIDHSDEGVVIYLLAIPPQVGKLLLNGEGLDEGSSFIQEDVNAGKLSFQANEELGSIELTDTMYLNVTDASGNMAAFQPLRVTVLASDNNAPQVAVGQGFEVMEGGRKQLTQAFISAVDSDSALSSLMVHINNVPGVGELRIITHHSSPDDPSGLPKVRQQQVAMFPLTDLYAGTVYYVQSDHYSKEPRADSFTFHVNDGTNPSPITIFNITILPANDEPPKILTETLVVTEGDTTPLTNSTLFVNDIDSEFDMQSSSQFVFTLTQPPREGHLVWKNNSVLVQGQQFSLQDVYLGSLGYRHTGREHISMDMFDIEVSDGRFTDSSSISVNIILVDDETPRIKINDGLRIMAGERKPIYSSMLHATDIDSDDADLVYKLTISPHLGHLVIRTETERAIAEEFTPAQIASGELQYIHSQGNQAGLDWFRFDVNDPLNNTLREQTFYITIQGDSNFPVIRVNNPLTVVEKSFAVLSSQHLYIVDREVEPDQLQINIIEPPRLGRVVLEDSNGFAQKVDNFTMEDILSSRVMYIHESASQDPRDTFRFLASDGFNNVSQTFYVRISHVDDSLPELRVGPLSVREGKMAQITEQIINVRDNDTQPETVKIGIAQAPIHGDILIVEPGAQELDYNPCVDFTLADLLAGKVFYRHDNSESTSDSFSIIVKDQTNDGYLIWRYGRLVRTSSPMTIDVRIQLVDDQIPIVTVNKGIKSLQKGSNDEITTIITPDMLTAEDGDTGSSDVVFTITQSPQYGLIRIRNDGTRSPTATFSQDDIDQMLISYTLYDANSAHSDWFSFIVTDMSGRHMEGSGDISTRVEPVTAVFNISWSFIAFNGTQLAITEEDGIIEIPVVRRGCIDQSIAVSCTLHHDTDNSAISHGSDITVLTPQITIDTNVETGYCRLQIEDDSIFEGPEAFYLELSDPSNVLLDSSRRFSLNLTDFSDEPIIQFSQPTMMLDEDVGIARVLITRTGDLSQSVTVKCSTQSRMATGSSANQLLTGTDYISLDGQDVHFDVDQDKAFCDIRIIDDTLYELQEDLELSLSADDSSVRFGTQSTASVIIKGPNDASPVEMVDQELFVFEDARYVSVKIRRQGADLMTPLTIWCSTEMAGENQATPGVDYVAISQAVTFRPGESVTECMIAILDDNDSPTMEGEETFLVRLASADPISQLTELDSTLVIIDDFDLDVPELSLDVASVTVNEDQGLLSVPIIRTGDLSCHVSVVCYTRQNSAKAQIDFVERPWSESSRVQILPGVKNVSCDLELINDLIHESAEYMMLKLGDAEGCDAITGQRDVTLVTITNTEDVPKISLDSSKYLVNEPASFEDSVIVKVGVTRSGDLEQQASVRLNTLDRSAISGLDYMAISQLLVFLPGEDVKYVTIPILYNPELEWHEAFAVVLVDPEGVFQGNNMTSLVNIMDRDMSGSLVLPSLPLVVSKHDFENGNVVKNEKVISGYPLMCITPCEPQHPAYGDSSAACTKAGINITAMAYSWEISQPSHSSGLSSHYNLVSQATALSRVDTKLLETFYFRPGFKVRCVATPLMKNGGKGIPLKSSSISVKPPGACMNPITSENIHTTGAQSFRAELDYIDSGEHKGKIHISIEIPHQDGMLPIISTLPIHNIQHLLAQSNYRRQHVCSNIVNETELLEKNVHLSSSAYFLSQHYGVDPFAVRTPQAQIFYQHLNQQTCRWKFEAWFDTTELINYCGARMTSNFDVESSYKSFVTVYQPLYVSYVYAQAPMGWVTLDHQAELEVSFYYDNSKFASGVDVYQEPQGTAELVRLGINSNGRLTLQFRTNAMFHGMFVLNHRTAGKDTLSELSAPDDVKTAFTLDLVWTQPTFDGPQQIWRAVSELSLQDYTGVYTLNLLACVASQSTFYTVGKNPKCAVQQTISVPISIAFQQINRPVPIEFSLDTEIQLTNSRRLFLMNPDNVESDSPSNFHGVFSKGDQLYGRVTWSKDNDLSDALRIQLEKVFICAGKNGYIPAYDPEGDIYNNGPQYGCLEPSSKLKHRLMILDRGADDITVKEFNLLPFRAEFTDLRPDLVPTQGLSTSGFVMNIDPLFTETTGQRWHVHILYKMAATDSYSRRKRAADSLGSNMITINLNFSKQNDIKLSANHNTADIKTSYSGSSDETKLLYFTNIVLPLVLIFTLLIIIIVVISVKRKTIVSHLTKNKQASSAGHDLHLSFDVLPPINRTESIYLDPNQPDLGENV